MRLRFSQNFFIAVALAVIAQITWVTVTPAFAHDGRAVTADASIGKPHASCLARSRHSASIQPWFGLCKIAGISGVALSAASLRFDLKQNLSTWPVLSDRLQRSPPLHIAL